MEPSWTSICYARHDPAGRGSDNRRNGTSSKQLKGAHGKVGIEVPRDRAGTFEPQIVRKGQTRLMQMDDQILALYAKGMSTRDIVDAFREMYDADVSPTLVSKVTFIIRIINQDFQQLFQISLSRQRIKRRCVSLQFP